MIWSKQSHFPGGISIIFISLYSKTMWLQGLNFSCSTVNVRVDLSSERETATAKYVGVKNLLEKFWSKYPRFTALLTTDYIVSYPISLAKVKVCYILHSSPVHSAIAPFAFPSPLFQSYRVLVIEFQERWKKNKRNGRKKRFEYPQQSNSFCWLFRPFNS